MAAKSNASDSTGHPGRASSSGRGTRWTCRCGTPLPRLNQFILAGRYSSSTAPATPRDVGPESRRLLPADSSVGSATWRPFQIDIGIAGPHRMPADVAVGPLAFEDPEAMGRLVGARARTWGTPRRGGAQESRGQPFSGILSLPWNT